MSRRDLGRGAIAARASATAALAIGLVAALPGRAAAQPDPAAAPAADAVSRARSLYRDAEAAMQAGRFDDAERDYAAAYELTKDGALLFKLGRAHQRAGRCAEAKLYFARYLREGHPTEQFAAIAQHHIAACDATAAPSSSPAGSAAGTAGNSAAPTTPAPSAPAPKPAPKPATDDTAEPVALADPAAPPDPIALRRATPSHAGKVAWLLTGSAIALVSLGGVLAYAADSSENDVRDLYVGLGGQPTTFDAETRARYRDLVDEGRRYERLSWTAFGVAGAAAIGAAVLFVVGRRSDEAPARAALRRAPRIVPIATARTAGVSVAF